MNRVALLTAIAVLLLVSVPAWGQSRYSANGHYYEVVKSTATWTAAKTAAAKKTYSGMTGYLVCITTASENTFVAGTVLSGESGTWWIGASQSSNANEPSGNWQWTSGEKWSYTSWNKGEPNDVGGEDVAEIYAGNGYWNDNKVTATRNYVVEYDPIVNVSVNDGEAATDTTSVTLTLEFESGDDAGVPQVRARNGTGTWSAWSTYSGSLPWILSADQGTKTVEVEFKDSYGLVYPVTDTIHLDTSAPTGTIAIAGGADWTNSSIVTLDLTFDDTYSSVSSMRFRNAGGEWEDWVPSAASATFTVPAGEGQRTVEAEFRDDAGNVSETAADSIMIDLIAPEVTLVAGDGGAFTAYRDIPLTITATDTGSGVDVMHFREIGFGDDWSEWVPYSASSSLTVRRSDGLKSIEVQVRDRAGNLSVDAANPVTIDTAAPDINYFRVNNADPYVLPGIRLVFELSGKDNLGGSGATDFRSSFDGGGTWSDWLSILGGGLTNIQRPTVDGLIRVRMMIRDGVGNESDASEVHTYLVEEDLPAASGGGKLMGSISPAGDVDAFVADIAKGDMLSVKVKGKASPSGSELLLAVDIANSAGEVLSVGRYPDDAKAVMIKGFVAPRTDRYYVLLRLDPKGDAKSCTHTLSVKVKQSKTGKKGKGESADGVVLIPAVARSLLKATMKGEGLTAARVTLVGPDGPVAFTAKEGKGSVKITAVLDAGTGDYEIRVDPATDVAWKWKLKLPKKVKAAIQG